MKARRRVGGTTLAAPATWAVIAGAGIAVAEAVVAWNRGETLSPFSESALRYMASCGTLMPTIAVLGAKRPQDRGWQWVVGALWATLFVPVMQLLVAKSTGPLELPPFWAIVVAWIIAMGLLNYIPTRNFAPAVLVALGQLQLVRSTVFDDAANARTYDRLLPIIFFALALVAARLLARTAPQPAEEANRRWLAFRDGWGAFWGLRVMQRLNQSAEAARLPARLGWNGWRATEGGELTADSGVQIDRAMDAVLWRFERSALT